MFKTIDTNEAFNYLIKVANNRKITNNQLCNGIYDSSGFSKIVSGKRKPTLDLILALAIKLNITITEIELYSVFELPDEYLAIKNDFDYYRAFQEYTKLNTLYLKYKNKYEIKELPSYKLFRWMKAIIESSINKNYLHSKEIIINTIKFYHPKFEINNIKCYELNEDELDMIHLIALYTYRNNQEDFLVTKSIYKALITYIYKNNMWTTNKMLLPKFCYQFGAFLIEQKELDEAIKYTDIGINYSRSNMQMVDLPYLYCNKALINAINNEKQLALHYFKKSLLLFKNQGRNYGFLLDGIMLAKKYNIEIEETYII